MTKVRWPRDLIAVALATALVAVFALWRMGYLSPATADQIRMTDNSRSAYIAKNLAEGNGYTTNDLPAALLDFYHREGRLDDARWENADRFPFTAYAIAGLYKVTGSTSYAIGITLYNALTFVGYVVALFALAFAVWGERRAALVAVALALMHPYTYRFLYFKDADSQLLATLSFLALHHLVQQAPHEASRWRKVWLGTLLGWTFLARPNVGAAFVLIIACWGLRTAWRARKDLGVKAAGRQLWDGFGVAALVMIAWCLPFAIDSMREWGTPFFSANNIYQLPLGTRFGMGTDTWWKYSEPGHTLTLAEMWRLAPDDMWAKLTTSWLATAKATLRMYGGELGLTAIVGLVAARRRGAARADAGGDVTGATLPPLLGAAGFAVAFNLAALPLYAYQDFSFVHYLAFALPVVWLAAGKAVADGLAALVETWPRLVTQVRQRPLVIAAVAVLVVLGWSLGSRASMINPWLVEPGKFASRHWLLSLLLLAAAAAHRWVWRPVTFQRGVVLMVIVVLARWRGDGEIRLGRKVFFPLTNQAAMTLRQARGLVSSFALQSEVAWVSGRRNIPAPEYALHLYSYRFEHSLDVQDIYLESAEAMIENGLGPFAHAAPGFETYARIQRYGGTFPGYQRVLQADGALTVGRISTGKASSVFRLTDPATADRMAESSRVLELGTLAAIVHTAYGFGGYVSVDGHPAVIATDRVSRRYQGTSEAPSEDVGITYTIGARLPTSVSLDVYAVAPVTIQLYQNVDLFEYTRHREVPRHRLATVALAPGWQTIHAALPPELTRRGVNKLGLTVDHFEAITVCPTGTDDVTCQAAPPPRLPSGAPDPTPRRLLRVAPGAPIESLRAAVLLGTLRFE